MRFFASTHVVDNTCVGASTTREKSLVASDLHAACGTSPFATQAMPTKSPQQASHRTVNVRTVTPLSKCPLDHRSTTNSSNHPPWNFTEATTNSARSHVQYHPIRSRKP